MEARILKILTAKKKQIENKIEQIESFHQDPLMFFNELQQDGDIIPDLLRSIDESLLLEYQNWQYPYVLKSLQETFNLSPFTVHWDTTIFPSPVYFMREGYPVAQIKPYQQRFEVLPDEELLDLLTTYKAKITIRIQKWEEHQVLLLKDWNPYIDADDSLTSSIKIAFKKKRMAKDRQTEQELLLNEINYLDEEIQKLLFRIDKISKEELVGQYELDKVYNQIKSKVPIKYKDLQEDAIYQTQEKIRELEVDAETRIANLRDKAAETEQLL